MKSLEKISDLVVIGTEQFEAADVRETLIISRIAQNNRVFFIQPPAIIDGIMGGYSIEPNEHNVLVIQPYLPEDISVFERKEFMQTILNQLIEDEDIFSYSLWVDSPKAMPYIRTLCPQYIVYNREPQLARKHPELESELKQYTDVVLDPRALSEAAFEVQGVVNLWESAMYQPSSSL